MLFSIDNLKKILLANERYAQMEYFSGAHSNRAKLGSVMVARIM